jgi:hypothetical protein
MVGNKLPTLPTGIDIDQGQGFIEVRSEDESSRIVIMFNRRNHLSPIN